ncbi:MAG: hypothetical protein KGQ51_17280 [Planctomycetes bacterium]|nr:hypothetical protein [Planctomycetota bacterium]
MSESESAIDDPLSKPVSESPTEAVSSRWLPQWFRILIAGVLIAAPALLLIFEDVGDRLAFSIVAWSGWSAIAFIAVQGPGQWRNTIGGILYCVLLACITLCLYRWFRPITFANWGTFWDIDFPLLASDMIIGWCVLRILSMISGIEIIDPSVRARPRWTLARWMVLMTVLAVLIQVFLFRMNWGANLSSGSLDQSVFEDSFSESPIVASRRVWLGIQLAETLFIPFVPILATGWMLAGRPWRWLMFPVLAAITIAEYALAEILVLEATKSLYSSVIEKEWALWGTFYWFAYGFAAILVPFMGFRWTDYWTRFPRSPSSNASVSNHSESITNA